MGSGEGIRQFEDFSPTVQAGKLSVDSQVCVVPFLILATNRAARGSFGNADRCAPVDKRGRRRCTRLEE